MTQKLLSYTSLSQHDYRTYRKIDILLHHLFFSEESRLRVVEIEDILAGSSSRNRARRGRPPGRTLLVPARLRSSEYLMTSSKKKFRCPRCPSSFSYMRGLQQHLKYACFQIPRFQCPYCEHRSKYRYASYNHIRQIHKGEEVYCVDVFENE